MFATRVPRLEMGAISAAALILAFYAVSLDARGSEGILPRLSVSSIAMNVDLQESGEAFTTLTLTEKAATAVHWSVVDPKGVIESVRGNPEDERLTYQLQFQSSPHLAPGIHRGEVLLNFCKDSGCTQHFANSPRTVPYEVTVRPARVPGPLVAWEGVGGRQTLDGNASHTGAVDVSLDPTLFRTRWRWLGAGEKLHAPIVAEGRVVVAGAHQAVYALDERDGTLAWVQPITAQRAGAPTLSGKLVLLVTGDGDAGPDRAEPMLLGFDTVSGASRYSMPLAFASAAMTAPTVFDGKAYVSGGIEVGLRAIDVDPPAAGPASPVESLHTGMLAADAGAAYLYAGNSCSSCGDAGLSVMDRASGGTSFWIPDASQDDEVHPARSLAPVVASPTQVLVVSANRTGEPSTLTSFDLAKRSIGWAVSGSFANPPVVSRGEAFLFDASTRQFQVRSLADGRLLWTWVQHSRTDAGSSCRPLATRQHVFVCTEDRVHAIDRSTHESVWSYGAAATSLALSENGVLYINRADDIETGLGHGLIALDVR